MRCRTAWPHLQVAPDLFPINYVVDGGTVVFRTAEGTNLPAALLGRGVEAVVELLDVVPVVTVAGVERVTVVPLGAEHQRAHRPILK